MASRIFIVDSSPAVRRMVEQISTPEGFEVLGFQDGPTALEAARRLSPDLIIADYHLDNITFSGFCKELNKHDNLSDTYIISLITLSDRPDENHLRSLGVKAFLKKPFQSEHLLEVIKSLQQDGKRTEVNGAGSKPKRKTWPPESQTTDTDELGELSEIPDDEPSTEEHEESHMDLPTSTAPLTSGAPASAVSQAQSKEESGNVAEEAMRGLLGHLVQSLTERAERRMEELLPGILSRQIEAQVSESLNSHIAKQFDTGIPAERIARLVRDGIAEELPKAMARQNSDVESLIRKSVNEAATSTIQKTMEQSIGELVEPAIRKQLPGIIREQLGSMDQLVKEAVQETASRHARDVAETVVREIAEKSIAQAVRQIVPDLAENHVKDEIKRLTS